MAKRTLCIILTVIGVAALAAGLGVLIWWLVVGRHDFRIFDLNGDGFGNLEHHAAFTRIQGYGDMFWWFYPTLSAAGVARPIILWLDGVTGLPPSLLANFGMFGPFDFDLNRRNGSWIDDYNLLFVDAPIGTGFSTANRDSRIPTNLEENTDQLVFTLRSFYIRHEDYESSPLYIIGQGHGAQLALSLAIRLNELSELDTGDSSYLSHNLKGVVLGNGIISPSLVLTKLGFYLEEMGYIDANGRAAVEGFSAQSNTFMAQSRFEDAFDHFLTLGDFVNEEAGTVAVNLGRITEKLTQETTTRDYFGQRKYLQDILRINGADVDEFLSSFMVDTVAPALGISTRGLVYDRSREAATNALRSSFMLPAVNKVEDILVNTNLTVTIYNGNLDAVSTTPGQLEWVFNLRWPGQAAFAANFTRQPLVVNRLLEGYFRETDRLKFYWMNAAGQSVPYDSPVAMRRVLQRITDD